MLTRNIHIQEIIDKQMRLYLKNNTLTSTIKLVSTCYDTHRFSLFPLLTMEKGEVGNFALEALIILHVIKTVNSKNI